MKGELGVKDLNLDATINAPGLDNALPGLGGTAKGLVKVRGTVEAPQLLADITARGLRWQELPWRRFAWKAISNPPIRLRVNLTYALSKSRSPM